MNIAIVDNADSFICLFIVISASVNLHDSNSNKKQKAINACILEFTPYEHMALWQASQDSRLVQTSPLRGVGMIFLAHFKVI